MQNSAADHDGEPQTPWALGELNKGNLHAALSGFATRFLLDYRGRVRSGFHADNDICGFGATLWLMGDRAGAAQVWANVCDAAYRGRIRYSSFGTFQAPLLLWFASVWLKNDDWHSDAEQTLTKLLSRPVPMIGSKFSAQLARILRKETTLASITATRLAETPPLVRKLSGQLSEHEQITGLFYQGVSEYENRNVAKTLKLWNQVRSPKDEGPLEYYLLRHECKKLTTVLRKSKKR
jgi:hypothetical protein